MTHICKAGPCYRVLGVNLPVPFLVLLVGNCAGVPSAVPLPDPGELDVVPRIRPGQRSHTLPYSGNLIN